MFKILLRWIDRYPWRVALAVLLVGISIVLALEPSWFISAIDAMRIPYAIFLVVLMVFFFIRGIHVLTTSVVIALLILLPDIWPYFKTADQTPIEERAEQLAVVKSDLSVLHYNVKEKNKNILSVAESAIASGADFVSMQELNESSLEKIDSLMKRTYSYSLSDVSVKGFGMAVYSKFPIVHGEVKKLYDYLFLTGQIELNGRHISFISATTSTPTNEKDYAKQMKQFKYITEFANTIDSALLVMGDMNAVPWSEQIKGLMLHTKLQDSRKDLSATYPAQSPLQIPIDYIFHSDELACVKFSTMGSTSSNHLGIIGYYNIRALHKDEEVKLKNVLK